MIGDNTISLNEQIRFLRQGQFVILSKLNADTSPSWGIMSAQQMVEHLSSLYLFSVGKIKPPETRNIEHEKKMFKKLIIEQHPFVKNVKIKGLEKPLPTRFPSLDVSIDVLNKMVNGFFDLFESNPTLTTWHPLCGDLNKSEWVFIHYKHALHHLTQFDLIR